MVPLIDGSVLTLCIAAHAGRPVRGGVRDPEEGVHLQARREGPVCDRDAWTQARGQGFRLSCEHLQKSSNSQIQVSCWVLEEKGHIIVASYLCVLRVRSTCNKLNLVGSKMFICCSTRLLADYNENLIIPVVHKSKSILSWILRISDVSWKLLRSEISNLEKSLFWIFGMTSAISPPCLDVNSPCCSPALLPWPPSDCTPLGNLWNQKKIFHRQRPGPRNTTLVFETGMSHSQPCKTCKTLLSTVLSANRGLASAVLLSHWPPPPAAVQKSPRVPWG